MSKKRKHSQDSSQLKDLVPISLPDNLGRCTEQFQGSSDLTIHLIASRTGHPADAEEAVLEVLRFLHGLASLQGLFINFDAALKSGDIKIQQSELELDPWRSLSDREAAFEATLFVLKSGLACAGRAFGMISEPRVPVHSLDDWYAWAVQRDALAVLNANGGKLILLEALLETVSKAELLSDSALPNLLELIRLGWTGKEWRKNRQALDQLDPAVLLSPFTNHLPEYNSIVKNLIVYKEQACFFYDSGETRIKTFIDKALQISPQYQAGFVAIVIDIAWFDVIADYLKSKSISYSKIIPVNVYVEPILDSASIILNDLSIEKHRQADMLMGAKIRTPIEILETRSSEYGGLLALSWGAAAQALAYDYEQFRRQDDLAKAEHCVELALVRSADDADAWSIRGEIFLLKGDAQASLTSFEKADALMPNTPLFLAAKARALDRLSRTRKARRFFVRSIYLAPRNSTLWAFLGEYFYNHGKHGEACYCFNKGRVYGSANCAQNYRNLCRSSSSIFGCPIELLPPVLFLASKTSLLWRSETFRTLLIVVVAVIYVVLAYTGAGELYGGKLGIIAFVIAIVIFIFSNTLSILPKRR
jgi:tetratricopeptide (TPR) repeat protein